MPGTLGVSGRSFCSIQRARLVVVALCSRTLGRLCDDEDDVDGDESSFLDRYGISIRSTGAAIHVSYFEFPTLILVLSAGLITKVSTHPCSRPLLALLATEPVAQPHQRQQTVA